MLTFCYIMMHGETHRMIAPFLLQNSWTMQHVICDWTAYNISGLLYQRAHHDILPSTLFAQELHELHRRFYKIFVSYTLDPYGHIVVVVIYTHIGTERSPQCKNLNSLLVKLLISNIGHLRKHVFETILE